MSRSAIRPMCSTSTRSTLEDSASDAAMPPEPLRQRDERAEHLHVLRADRRDVDRGRDDAAGERGDDLLGGLHAGAVLRLGGRGAEVRRDDDVGVAEQRVLGDRLRAEDVQRRAGDLAGVQRGLQVGVDDEPAAGDVDDAHAVLAPGERLGVRGSRASPASWAGGRVRKSAAA